MKRTQMGQGVVGKWIERVGSIKASTVELSRVEMNKRVRKKGDSKTGGRVKGTPNKMTTALKDMILGALDELGGQKYLKEQAIANPASFMTLLGKVLPSVIEGPGGAPLFELVSTEVLLVGLRDLRELRNPQTPERLMKIPGVVEAMEVYGR